MEKEITPKEKARQLVNDYYGYDGVTNQREAIEVVERIILTNFCQQADRLHGHAVLVGDYDLHLIKADIIQLKWQQEVAYELRKMKNSLQV